MGDAIALYVRDQRALHVLNPTATLLFECLERPASLAALVERMRVLTDAPPATLERDLQETLDEMVRKRLVEARE